MQRGDIKRAVELALRTWPDRSQRMIAEQVGCAQTMVSYVKSQVSNIAHVTDAPATVTGRDGGAILVHMDPLHRLLQTWRRVGLLLAAEPAEPAHRAAAQRVACRIIEFCLAAHLDLERALLHGELVQR